MLLQNDLDQDDHKNKNSAKERQEDEESCAQAPEEMVVCKEGLSSANVRIDVQAWQQDAQDKKLGEQEQVKSYSFGCLSQVSFLW